MFSSAHIRRWPVALGLAVALTSGVAIAQAPANKAKAPANKAAPKVADASHPGFAAYQSYCSECHDNGETSGAPSTEAIRGLSRANVKYTLELGYMKQQAQDVPKDELAQIIDWLPKDPTDAGGWTKTYACKGAKAQVNLAPAAKRSVVNFGIGLNANRAMTAQQAGLTKADMANLELAWVVAFPQTSNMRSQPVIVGDTLFFAATDSGHVYAMDAGTGCVKWTYHSDMTLRSSLSFAEATKTSPARIIAGDAAGRVHAIDAKTGKSAWVTDIKLTSVNRVTGSPMVLGSKVIVPLSAIEVNYAGPDAYGCCVGQGAVVGLDVATGKKLWVGRTMEDAKPTIKGRTGVQQMGPSGAIIWSTPVIDAKRNVAYAGTGENTSWPATDTSDSVIAYDLDTGARKWVFQATKADIWNYACGARGANCDWPGEYQSPDHDFGGTSMLIKRPDGSELVVAGQKAGVLWGLNPDTGAMEWSNKISRGSAGGGVRWGLAYDGENIYAPSNDPAGPATDNPNWGAGIHAIDPMTGMVNWSYKPNNRDCGENLPAAAATRPTGAARMQRVVAPVLPPARVAPAANAGRGGAGRGGAAGGRGGGAAPQARAGGGESSEGAPARGARGGAGARCRVGMAAAPIVVDGAVVTGTNGGMLRIFDGKTGAVLFEYQTNKPYPNTVNGVPGKGGSLDSVPYVAANGTLYVQSGYSRFGQPPGNVLLAFRPKKKS